MSIVRSCRIRVPNLEGDLWKGLTNFHLHYMDVEREINARHVLAKVVANNLSVDSVRFPDGVRS